MADALVADVGDVEQAVDAAEVDEGAVIGDVLDHAVDDLALGQRLDQAGALLGAGLLEDGAARDDDIAAAAVHLEDLEGLGDVHQRPDVADRADVDLAAGQEGDGAAEVDGEAALDAAEDHALDAVAGGELGLELVPGGLAAGAVAAEHRLALDVLDAVDIDLDLVADLDLGLLARRGELAQRDAAFRLQADVDDGHVVLDRGDGALDDPAFEAFILAAEGFVEQRREIVAGRHCRGGHKLRTSFTYRSAPRVRKGARAGPELFAAAAPCRMRRPSGGGEWSRKAKRRVKRPAPPSLARFALSWLPRARSPAGRRPI